VQQDEEVAVALEVEDAEGHHAEVVHGQGQDERLARARAKVAPGPAEQAGGRQDQQPRLPRTAGGHEALTTDGLLQ
jgi:hypothetical protein